MSRPVDPVYDFALRIARALQASKSSTALFFVQQAYPDDVEAPADQPSSDAILENVIALASAPDPMPSMARVRGLTDDLTRTWKGHPEANRIIGSTVGLVVKHMMPQAPVDCGEEYWEDSVTGLWAHAPYSWCDRVVVLKGSTFADDLTREEFAAKYPAMVRIPTDPREWYALMERVSQLPPKPPKPEPERK